MLSLVIIFHRKSGSLFTSRNNSTCHTAGSAFLLCDSKLNASSYTDGGKAITNLNCHFLCPHLQYVNDQSTSSHVTISYCPYFKIAGHLLWSVLQLLMTFILWCDSKHWTGMSLVCRTVQSTCSLPVTNCSNHWHNVTSQLLFCSSFTYSLLCYDLWRQIV
jgi:hypothetical protein